MKPEFTPRESAFAKRRIACRINERLARRLSDIAKRFYEGNTAAAIEGLLLYDWMAEVSKKKLKKKHEHWISAPMVLRSGELEPAIDRLEADDCDDINAFIDVKIDEREKAQRPRTPSLNGFPESP